MVETRKAAAAAKSGDGSGRATLEDLYRQIQAGQAKELRIILKADVSGSLGAITHALEQLDQDEIRINVLLEGAGDITDNDIMLAAASDAIVVGFNTKITDTARRAAEAEGVDVRLYDIIYKLTDDIEAALKGLLEPEIVEVVEGRAEVRQIIRVGKNTVIAGSLRDRRAHRPRRQRPRLARRQGHRDRPDRVAAPLPRRRPRGRSRTTSAASAWPNFHDLEEGDIIECFTSQTVSRVAGQLRRSQPALIREPANRAGRRAPAAGDRGDPRAGGRGPADRVRDDHRRRDDAGPAPRQGLGQRHRPAGRARRRRCARSGTRCRSSGTSSASGCGSGASRTSTSSSTTRPSAGRASSSCSTSSRRGADPADGPSPIARVAADPGRRALPHEPTTSAEEPPSAVGRRCRRAPRPRRKPPGRADRARKATPVTVDLAP